MGGLLSAIQFSRKVQITAMLTLALGWFVDWQALDWEQAKGPMWAIVASWGCYFLAHAIQQVGKYQGAGQTSNPAIAAQILAAEDNLRLEQVTTQALSQVAPDA